MAPHVLVADDDAWILRMVATVLEKRGYSVETAVDGEDALARALARPPDLLITDVMMPKVDGWSLVRQLRAHAELAMMPVIFLTALSSEDDRIRGFRLGADDYVTKPFSPREVVARVKAILRRVDDGGAAKAGAKVTVKRVGDVEIDLARREAKANDSVVALATREFDLLAYLVDNQGIALSRQQLLDGVWGPDWYGDDRTVDVHVRQLRKKFGDALPLTTVWGVGYRLA